MAFGMVEDPINLDERAKVAKTCVAELNMPMPAILDKLDDKVNKAYKGWPDRLYLVGVDGKLKHAGGRGPFFFSPTSWEKAIKTELRAVKKKASKVEAAKGKG